MRASKQQLRKANRSLEFWSARYRSEARSIPSLSTSPLTSGHRAVEAAVPGKVKKVNVGQRRCDGRARCGILPERQNLVIDAEQAGSVFSRLCTKSTFLKGRRNRPIAVAAYQ